MMLVSLQTFRYMKLFNFRRFSEQPLPPIVQTVNKTIYNRDLYSVSQDISIALSVEEIADVLKDVPRGQIHKDYLVLALRKIVDLDLEKTNGFWSHIYPLVKHFINIATYFDIQEFCHTLIYLSKMGIQDNDLWNIISQKLEKERLYKYINEFQIEKVINSLKNVNRGSENLMKLLEEERNQLDQFIEKEPNFSEIANCNEILNLREREINP